MSTPRVYRNLQRKCYSIAGCGRVQHARRVKVARPTFRVWKHAHERYKRTHHRTVCAFVVGSVEITTDERPRGMVACRYDKEGGKFVLKTNGETVIGADNAFLDEEGLWLENPVTIAEHTRKEATLDEFEFIKHMRRY